jgi:ribose-phosphate pyrophosphokinase
MNMKLFSGGANRSLSEKIADKLDVKLGNCLVENFPDDEVHIEVFEDIHGADIYLIQPTCPPVAHNLLELVLLADACRRAGAARITGIVPYFGYARQDRRVSGREPVGAGVVSNMLSAALDRIVVVDLHTEAIEGFFSIPMEQKTAVPILADMLKTRNPEKSVLVAPDLGAVKLVHRYADILNWPVAYVYKQRLTGEKVDVKSIIGTVAGLEPIVVDDMISTGGTMVSTANALLERDCIPEITLVASHGLFVGKSLERFSQLPIKEIIVTDSVASALENFSHPVRKAGLADLLARSVLKLKS